MRPSHSGWNRLNPFLIPMPNEEGPNAFHIAGRTGCPPLIFLDDHRLRGPGGLEEELRKRSGILKGGPPGPIYDDYIFLAAFHR